MSLYILQHYWWILISILGGALVFLHYLSKADKVCFIR